LIIIIYSLFEVLLIADTKTGPDSTSMLHLGYFANGSRQHSKRIIALAQLTHTPLTFPILIISPLFLPFQ
jgi:hypothetical protein